MEKGVDANGTKLKRYETVTCTKCWKKGHNKRNCSNQPQDHPPGTYIDKRWGLPPSLKKRRPNTSTNVHSGFPINVAVDVQSGSTVVASTAINVAVTVQSRQVVAPLMHKKKKKTPCKF